MTCFLWLRLLCLLTEKYLRVNLKSEQDSVCKEKVKPFNIGQIACQLHIKWMSVMESDMMF